MTDYYEVVLDGNTDVLRGFIAGYLAGSGLARRVFVARESHVEHDSLAHQLGEWIGLIADRTHLILPDEAHERIRLGTARLGDQLKLDLVATRRLSDARFEVSWRTYNREEADRLRAIFAAPPEGVVLDDYETEEEVYEDEKGETGGYAPAHPYDARGSGVAHGQPGAVIDWAAELREDSLVEVEKIKLEYSD